MKLRTVDSTIPLIPRSSTVLSSTWNLINAARRWRWRRCRRRSCTNLQVRQQNRADFKFPLLFDLHSVTSAWEKKWIRANGWIRVQSPCVTVVLSFLLPFIFFFPRLHVSSWQTDRYRTPVKSRPLFSGYLIFVSLLRVRDFKSLFCKRVMLVRPTAIVDGHLDTTSISQFHSHDCKIDRRVRLGLETFRHRYREARPISIEDTFEINDEVVSRRRKDRS